MVLRINPNQPALWRDPKRMQLGVGNDQLVLKNLSKAQEQLIGLLYRGIADESLPEMNRHLGLSEHEANEVLDQVGPLLLRQPNQNLVEPELSSEYIASAFSEIIRASLVHGVDGQQILSARSKRSVHIEDLSKPGLAVALGLAAAGRRQLRVDVGDLGGRVAGEAPADHALTPVGADRHVENAAGGLDDVAFLDVLVSTQNHGADGVALEVQRQAEGVVGELQHLALHHIGQAVDAANTVGHGDHRALVTHIGVACRALDTGFDQFRDFCGIELHDSFLLPM